MNGEPVVVADGLRKRYGDLTAVDGISFQVGRGEIFGMVGPNGAGKTTTVECVEGLRRPDAGRVAVLGLDPWRDAATLRERIGVQLQAAGLPQRIKVGEAVGLFAAFYRQPADGHALLARLGLGEARRQYVSQLSGGQRQRLFVALALINRPEVVFLDELTTGLDPQGRRAAWDLVREIRAEGATVVLTTHFMDEAERLCDRVAIVDRGRIVALDAPAALVQQLGAGMRIVFEADGDLNAATLGVLDGVRRVARDGEHVIVYGGSLAAVVNTLEAGGVRFRNLRTEGPNLEDVFLALTAGRAARGPGSDRQDPGSAASEQRSKLQ
jgi:ABC-2 type transport system ATP-binding protein